MTVRQAWRSSWWTTGAERRTKSECPLSPERTQLGSGNTLKDERSLIPKSSLMSVDRMGVPSGEGLDAQQAGA